MNDSRVFAHHLLKWLLEKEEMPYEVLSINNLMMDTARKNDKRNANIRFVCPDEWVKNLSGEMKLLDAYMVIRVPREILDEWSALRESASLKGTPPSVDGLSPLEQPSGAIDAPPDAQPTSL